MFGSFIALALALFAGEVQAGFQIEQKVTTSSGIAEFSWRLGEREFRLDVKRGHDIRHYVFNGHVFYVCGRLDKAQLDYVHSLSISDPKLLQNLEKGACQELSTGFALRFFFSPYDATQSVEVSGGFANTLSVSNAQTSTDSKTQTIAGFTCADFTRSYQLKDASVPANNSSIEEKGCFTAGINWRQAFQRELSMSLMRHSSGRLSFQAVTQDAKKQGGMTLNASLTAVTSTGKKSLSVLTTGAKEISLPPSETSMPQGYQVINPQSLAALAAVKSRTKAADSGTTSENQGLADVLRALILGANPLSGWLPH